jgi:endoglucanase
MVMYLGAEKAGIRLSDHRQGLMRVGELMFNDASFNPVKGKTDELFSALFHRQFVAPERAYSETTAFPADQLSATTFKTPGEYRVFVPGPGVSGPLRIAADVWEQPFKAAMQGILAQRQGIDLGPPACAYARKRPFHPDDGVEFYQMTMPEQGGAEGARGKHLIELAKSGPLERVTGIWGGYQDAGDWDTVGGHLSATYDLLGLYDLNPAAFARMKLSLPTAEMKNDLPGILDEALWQMPLWRRLQLPDGGVRGGYGDGWGYYAGETSSMLKYAGVYAVDHETTLRYAAAGARAARVLAAFDKKLAAEYLESPTEKTC